MGYTIDEAFHVSFFFLSQMQNAMQVKPAESESRSGKLRIFMTVMCNWQTCSAACPN